MAFALFYVQLYKLFSPVFQKLILHSGYTWEVI